VVKLLGATSGEGSLSDLWVGAAGGRTHPVTAEILTNDSMNPGSLFTMFN
jgi:hypothetical protein